MTRRKLPARRLVITQRLEWLQRTWLLGLGFDEAGNVREAFVDGVKTGSEIEAWADDSCMVLSRLLQQEGESATGLLAWLAEAGSLETGAPAPSLLAEILRAAVRAEEQDGEAVREAYLCAAGRHPHQLARKTVIQEGSSGEDTVHLPRELR